MLIGEKIILRPLKIQDINLVNQWRNDLELTRQTMGIRFPKTLEMDEEWFNQVLRDKSNRNIYWGIEIKESHEFIGIASLTNIDYISGVGDFGWMIGSLKFRGLGYGKEAEKLINEYAFSVLNLRKLVRYILDHNTISRSILSNGGLSKEEGRLKDHYYFDGRYHDVIIMALFRDDYYKSLE
jgi:RimJ/RimL family protein N-acetyltransferase